MASKEAPKNIALDLYTGQRFRAHGPVVQKPINANPRLRIKQGVCFSSSKNLFSADIRQNFRLEEVNLEN